MIVLATGLLAGAVWLAFASGTRSSSTQVTGPTNRPVASAPTNAATTAAAVVRTDDAEEFVRAVATKIFTWDTRSDTGPAALVEPFVPMADPTGESTPGLIADLTNYLPSQEAWSDLRDYETRQWLTVNSVLVPAQWSTALEQAGPGAMAPGTIAQTVRGLRHRSGVWEGEPVNSEHEVVFTVFVVCRPSYPQCHLLRLSRLDDPLH
ncbi:hypothetical protein AFL01nite_02710 [Aeromicrobium flavum]|uniref:Secreted protein n=1 Tax=Aeromicrobium flavum TaxID=416568 RepID=A0A512HR59_9ACTN|nr:hypothetical protein [Aeromicrobium flavum]GEO87944.1 hypothetical protein AFL01nite_02710 [Aeromicrobium flavum]